MVINQVQEIYQKLFTLHGPQGWWPIEGKYHKDNFEFPKNELERFEICLGTILTQNTTWNNAELCLNNLKKAKLLDPQKLLSADETFFMNAIRPSGYFNQKSKKIRLFAEFYLKLGEKIPERQELLNLWGIGPETADSMLLYAFKIPHFVVDAYTKRIFFHLKLINPEWSYERIKAFFENNLNADFKIYQEYHALIVEHAKKYYSKKPYGLHCPLERK